MLMDQPKQMCFDLRLLYAEDDKNIQEIMKKILKRRFSEVICTCNGKEALEAFQAGNIDLVITDINMPCIGGLELCTKIREVDEDIPIMLTTAFNETDYLIEALQIGVDRFLFKPINTEILDRHLRVLVKRVFLFKQSLERARS